MFFRQMIAEHGRKRITRCNGLTLMPQTENTPTTTHLIGVRCALHDLATGESFAEYVPAPCTHRPSNHPSEVLVRRAMNASNRDFARRVKS